MNRFRLPAFVVLLLVVFFIPDGIVGRWRQLSQRRKLRAATPEAEPDVPAVSLAGAENESAL